MKEKERNILIKNIYKEVLKHKRNGESLVKIGLLNHGVDIVNTPPCIVVTFDLIDLNVIENHNLEFDNSINEQTKANKIIVGTFKVSK
jgi:hypothetical protein